MDKLRRAIVGRQKNADEDLDVIVLGYEDLAIPFMVLLAGIGVAFIQLGIEAVKKCIDAKRHNPK